MLRFQDIFCIKYSLNEGCSKCNYNIHSTNYLKPYFNINEEEINIKINLEFAINKLLVNDLTQCSLCGFTKDGVVIDKSHPNYYRIINNIQYPL